MAAETMPTMDTGTAPTYASTLYLVDVDRPHPAAHPAYVITVPLGVALDDGDVIPGVAFHSAALTASGAFVVVLDVAHESIHIDPDPNTLGGFDVTIGGVQVVNPSLNEQPGGFTGDTHGRLVAVYLTRIDTRRPRDHELLTRPFVGAFHQMWRQSPSIPESPRQ